MDYIKKVLLPFFLALATAFLVLLAFAKANVDFGAIRLDLTDNEREPLLLGEPIAAGDFLYTVTDVETTDTLYQLDDSLAKAKEGYAYTVISLHVENESKKSRALAQNMFALYDQKNKKYDGVQGIQLKRKGFKEPYRFLLGGETVSTYLIFQLPKEQDANILFINVNEEYKKKSKRKMPEKGPKYLEFIETKEI